MEQDVEIFVEVGYGEDITSKVLDCTLMTAVGGHAKMNEKFGSSD